MHYNALPDNIAIVTSTATNDEHLRLVVCKHQHGKRLCLQNSSQTRRVRVSVRISVSVSVGIGVRVGSTTTSRQHLTLGPEQGFVLPSHIRYKSPVL